MSIPTRNVPALGRNVGAIGLGCMGISWAYAGADTSSDTAGAPILAHALESGIDFFDTSDAYAAGHNERVVGRALAGTDAVIATLSRRSPSAKTGRRHPPFQPRPMNVPSNARRRTSKDGIARMWRSTCWGARHFIGIE